MVLPSYTLKKDQDEDHTEKNIFFEFTEMNEKNLHYLTSGDGLTYSIRSDNMISG